MESLEYRSEDTGIRTIAVCSAQVPFFSGGAELHVNELIHQLRLRGYEVELISLPYKWYPRKQLLRSIEIWQKIDLTESNGKVIDLVIATKFPSYFVQHPRKVLWLIHQYRQIYDLIGTEYSDFDMTRFADRRMRRKLEKLDTAALAQYSYRFSNAQNTADRLKKFNGLDAQALYHPPSLAGRYQRGPYQGYILSVGRLDKLKRIDSLIKALAHCSNEISCKIAGTGPEREALEALAKELNVEDRVEFLGYVADDDLISLYSNCSAVFFAPRDEDYGYITLEAFLSGKPVITAADSGGPLEFVQHGDNGIVMQNLEPASVAGEITSILQDPATCQRLGEAGAKAVEHIGWNHVIKCLLGGYATNTSS